MKQKFRLSIAMVLNFTLPGIGHVYLGQSVTGLLIVSFAVTATLLISYLAAVFGPWAMAVGAAINLCFHIYMIWWTYLIFKTNEKTAPKLWAAGLAVVITCTHLFFPNIQRVRVFHINSDSMAPKLVGGDNIAVDRFNTDISSLAKNDLVIVTIQDRPGEYVRKILGISGDTVTVATNDSQFEEEKVLSKNIVGRVLYIAYSYNSNPFKIRWDRTLKNITL